MAQKLLRYSSLDLSSLDFVVNRLFMKLFKTSNIDVVKCCQDYFGLRYDTRCYFNVRSKADISQLNLPHGFDLPSMSWSKRVKKFDACNNLLCRITQAYC